MSLFYSAITNEKQIICSCAVANRDLESIVHTYLSRGYGEGQFFYNQEGMSVHALNVGGISYLAITQPTVERLHATKFLTKVAETFCSNAALVQQAKHGSAKSLQHSFGPTLTGLSKNFEELKPNRELAALQSNVEGVTNQLRQNVTELMRRGDLAESLVDKTANLESDAKMFETCSKKVEKKERCTNRKMKFIMIGVGVAVLAILIIIILWQTGALSKK